MFHRSDVVKEGNITVEFTRAARNCERRKFSMTSSLVRLACNDLFGVVYDQSAHKERCPRTIASTNVHQYDLNDHQRRPNNHEYSEVISSGLDPTPYKGPKPTGNNADESLYYTGVLKLFDENNNEANETAQAYEQQRYTHRFALL